MSTPSLSRDPDELAQLRTEVAALRGELHRHAAPATPRPRRLPRRFLPLALVALLVVLTPLATFAANPFTDLTGSVHDPNIDLIYNAGITTGCVPNAQYCPKDTVTREQMASFLARTAGLGTNPPVVNAKTAQTATNATNAVNATNATTATNANTVGGYAPSALLRADFTAKTNATGATLTGTPTSQREITVTAPGPGYMLVIGHLGIYGQTGCPCTGVARLHDLSSATALSSNHYESIQTTGQYGDTTVTWLFPVTAGSRTFALEASSAGGTQTNGFLPSLATVFVPFGSSVATATGAEIPGIPGQTP